MAKATRVRKKNRQLKVTIDIPDQFKDDADFMEALQDTLDAQCESEWCLRMVGDGDGVDDASIEATIHSISLGDVLIEPDDEDEDD